jgi:TP901 family phage tail tape measure protein
VAIDLEELVARIRLDTSGLAASMGQVQSSLANAGSQMQSVGKKATAGLTLPLVGIAAAGTKLAADFDLTMRQVGIATGGATESMKELALQMGQDTAFSAKDAADAMLELAKGGLTAAQIEGGALKATMTAAAAGGVSLADASTLVSNAMATFGLKAADAGKIAVALAGGANASSASMSSLQQGLQAVGGVAASAGLSLNETVGALSAFDAQGLKGSDAGTSLKAMLNTLVPTTNKAKDAMSALGLDFVKANGDFESMTNIAGQLDKALGPLPEAQRNLALETIFGADGMRAANAMMNLGSDGLRKYEKATRDTKTTNELANASMEGLSGAIEQAKGSLETAAIVIGTTLAPMVEKVAGYVMDAANAFSALSPQMQTIAVAVGAVLAGLGPLLVVLGTVVSSLGTLVGLFTASAPAATAAGAAAGASVAPFLLVAGAIAGVVAGFVLLYQRSESFRTVVQTGLAQVATAFQNMLAAVQPIVQQVVGVFVQEWPKIQQTIQQVFGSVKSIVASAFSIIQSVVRIATAVVLQVWATFGDTILSTIRRVLGAVQQVIRGAFQIIQGIFKTVAAALRGDWSGMWDGIVQIAKGIGNVLAGVVKGAWALVRGAFSAAFDVMQELARSFWTAVVDTFGNGVTRAVNKVQEIKGKITSAFSNAGDMLLQVGKDIVNGLVNGIQAVAGDVYDAAMSLVDKIPGPIRKVMGISSPSKVMEQIGKYIGDGLVKGLTGTQAQVRESIGGLIDLLRKANRDGLVKMAKETQAALLPLAKEYARQTRLLETYQGQLDDLVGKATQLRESIVDVFAGTAGFSGIEGQRDEEGNELPLTYADVRAAREAAAARANEFQQVMQQLEVAGLSQPQLQELAAAGPAALEVARATLQGGAEGIAALNNLHAMTIAAGSVVADQAAQGMYGAGIATVQGLIDGLDVTMPKLEKQMNRIAKAMVRAIRKALKIQSPSRVMEGLGDQTAAGFIGGLDQARHQVAAAASRMANAAVVRPPNMAGVVAGANAGANVRVFIGERELTDIVRVEVGGTLAPLSPMTRQGVI